MLSARTISSINRPVRQLSEAAAHLAEGQFDTRAPVGRQDELGQLAQVFNTMAGELQELYAGLEARAGTAEARLLQAVESIPLGVVLYDADGRLVLCNEQYRAMWAGAGESLVPGARFAEIECDEAGVTSGVETGAQGDGRGPERLERHQSPRPAFDLELSDGRWLEVSEFRTQEGGIFAVRADITERKRAEEELRKAKEAAEAARAAMTEFVSMAGHELRTPLTYIYDFAIHCVRDLRLRIFPNVQSVDPKTQRAVAEVSEYMDIIVDEGERMTALINDMLDLAKIEAGKVDRHVERLSVDALIHREVAGKAQLFEEKNLKLITDCEPGLPEVLGDRNQLIRVLENLLSNAFKFTAEGSVTCRAVHREGEVMVSVIDTGRGIDPADLERIFEKFIQAGDPVTSRSKGTGLGLPIARAIVEQHGGWMWAESEPGQGSTFSFTLPVAPPHGGAQAPDAAQAEGGIREPAYPDRG